jgi:hypothetical protein
MNANLVVSVIFSAYIINSLYSDIYPGIFTSSVKFKTIDL